MQAEIQGLTLAEARERYTPIGLWERLADLEGQLSDLFQRLSRVYPRTPPGMRYTAEELALLNPIKAKEIALEHTRRAIDGALLQQATRGTLVLIGRRGTPTADPMIIPAAACNWLQVEDWYHSILVERTPERFRFYDVRVFPASQAPKWIGPAARADDSGLSQSPAAETKKQGGRKDAYDWPKFGRDLEENKPFPSREAVIQFGLEPGRVQLRPGEKPPVIPGTRKRKKAGDPPERHTLTKAMEKPGFWDIPGLIE